MYRFTIILFLLVSVSSIAQQPELVLPVGHTNKVRAARFSPDGQFMVSGGLDKQVMVWETLSGRLIHDLTDCHEEISDVGFTKNGHFIYAFTGAHIYAWTFPAQKLVVSIPSITSFIFSPDEKMLYTRDSTGVLSRMDLSSFKSEALAFGKIYPKTREDAGQIMDMSENGGFLCNSIDSILLIIDLRNLSVIEKKMKSPILNCFFSPDNKKIILVTGLGCKQVLLSPGYAIQDFAYGGELAGSAVSPNKKYLLVWSPYYGNFSSGELWNIETEKEITMPSGTSIHDTIAVADSDGTIRYMTGTVKVPFPSSGFGLSGRAIISNNGQLLHTANVLFDRESDDRSVLLPTWNVIRKTEYSPDSRYVIVQIDEGPLQLWESGKTTPVTTYRSISNRIGFAEVNPAGTKMLVGGYDSTVKQVDLITGKTDFILTGHTGLISSARFSTDGEKILTNSYDSTTRLWNSVSGQLLNTYSGHHVLYSPGFFDENGKVYFTAPRFDSVEVYDIEGNSTGIKVIAREWEYPLNVSGSRTGRYTVKTLENAITILSDSAGSNGKTFTYDEWTPSLWAFSPNEKWLAMTMGYKEDIAIWDIENKTWAFKGNVGYQGSPSHGASFRQLLFSPDSKLLLVFDGNDRVHVLSAQDHSRLSELAGQYGSFSADGTKLVIVNRGICDLYQLPGLRHLYSYISINPTDFLVYDDQKRYDGTPEARKLLYYSCGREIVDLEQFKDLLWVPDLTERILKNDSINARKLDELPICGITPEVNQKDDRNGYRFLIHPRTGGLGETAVFVNGIEVLRAPRTSLKRSGDDYELFIPRTELEKYFVTGKGNKVSVKAYTSDNMISSRGVVINTTASETTTAAPNLYAVMVGVSDYKGTDLDLKYAAKDANDLSKAVASAAGKLLNSAGQQHVFTYNLTTANDHYLLPEKTSIKKTLDEIAAKATPNDILFLFFAGHGVMDPVTHKFYFLTSDASPASTWPDVGISTEELTDWIKPQHIAAQKRILIFDACNSGEVIKEFVKIGKDDQGYVAARNDDKGQQVKVIERLNEQSGLFILSASASSQSAYELGRYAQGVLTYSLLKAIKEDPEILQEGKYLDVSRWFHAASQTVNDIVRENGARQEPQVVSNTNFNVGIVDDEVMASIILPTQKPVFTASVFLNNDENVGDDDLDISKQVNRELSDLSTRGTDNRIIYLVGTNSSEAYTLTGRYEVKNGNILLRCNLKQHGKIIEKFETEGTVNNIHEMVTAAVNSAIKLVNK